MSVDGISLDWKISMKEARRIAGPEKVLAGNIDPIILYGSNNNIELAVKECIEAAGKRKHILNLGHGIEKDMTEESVATFVNAAKLVKL